MLSCPFGGRRKVQVTNFVLEELDGSSLVFTAFYNGLDANYNRASAFCFFSSLYI